MPRYINKTKKGIGRAPEDLVFKGDILISELDVTIIDFDAHDFFQDTIKEQEGLKAYNQGKNITWLNVNGLHDVKYLEDLAIIFDLDKTVIAEVLKTNGRPRVIEFKNCILISLKMLYKNLIEDVVYVENVSFILMKDFVITFQERTGDVFNPVRERIKKKNTRLRNRGADYLTFALLDIVLDNYLYVISELGEKIEALEDNLLDNPDQKVIENINALKKELNFLRKNVKPAREMIISLAKLDSEYISEDCSLYYKELLSNVNQASDVTDSYREILSDQLNVYHTTLSSKLNDVMKVLTVFSVVFIPLTFIAGIYGTNFLYIPELSFKYSYHLMWVVMLLITLVMITYFKKKKWL